MVELFSNAHVYKHPWSTVSSAFWLKYPNPSTPHVTEVDTVSRTLDAQGVLTSTRVITCQSTLPAFIARMGAPSRVYALEESSVDPASMTLTVKSRNFTGASFLVVEETCTYSQHPSNPNWTLYKQNARITAFAPLFNGSVEQFSLTNVTKNAQKGLQVMEGLCQLVSSERFDVFSYLTNLAYGQ